MFAGSNINENKIKLINIKLVIEYNGKNYFGWQKQKNKPSIQQTIEKSLQVLFPGYKIKLIGAGRTDTGVHALNQVANFKIDKSFFYPVNFKKLYNSLNSILPDDIAVKKVSSCKESFHARYSAKKRIYLYYLRESKSALYHDYVYRLKTKFDIYLAKYFCKLLAGEHSFKQYSKNKNDKHDFSSIVYYAKILKQKDGLIRFEICANRFLHSMVRALVGIMIQIASGKLLIVEFKTKFYKGVPIKIQYVPAKALFLKKIIY
jgi:tRNA pseudouridine38-40 synthase